MSFVHLHTHSHYSLLDGLTKIPELVAAVKEKGMSAVALTDHGNMHGAVEFYQAAKYADIKPIIGLEAYVAPEGIATKTPRERPYHLILLAINNTGYENLIKLLTIANLEGFYYKPRIDMQLLREYNEGIVALSGCLSGQIPRALQADEYDKAKAAANEFLDIFGRDRFYLEVQKNSMREQQIVNDGLRKLHEELNIEFVATADSHYIHPEDNEAQDVLVCIGTKKLLGDEDRFTMKHEDLSLKSPDEMVAAFADFERAAENTVKIAERAHIDIDLETLQLPSYVLPEGFTTADEYLTALCEEGAKKKYPEVTPEIRERLDYELSVILKTGYASYFLIVQDFINWAKNAGIAVGPGRGSAAGSIVAFLTGITDIDPIRYELIFERFLNPERISMPDIDTDFADTRRDDVLRYVEEKYGKDHVAQIITFGTIGARAGVRDVGRVLGLSYGYCDRISKLIPMFTSLTEAVNTVPELRQMMNDDADAQRLIGIAKKLEGVARHTSIHACAVVITKDPLNQMVPLQQDQTGESIITQYSMNPIEKLGLLKMDFLGLKNLSIIEDTLNIVAQTRGEKINIEDIPLNDKKTFQLLQKAQTIGVFQLESSGMRRYLKQLKPTEIEDIIVMVSLYRPGPMDFIPTYIEGKHGKREITYIHERLQPVLEKTYGIAVYQEQIMEIARSLAGFTYGEADVLRKAVGKKDKELLDEQEYKMIDGMVKNGIPSTIAKEIWEFILPFARYGFNRSHAACYAMIAYRTAYLKANYPAEFMAALMNADRGDTDRIAIEVVHAQDMGITVLPPDVNESVGSFMVVERQDPMTGNTIPAIRFGLHAIKNVGDHIIEVLIAERNADGAYTSIENFLSRIQDKDLNKKSLESLIKSGAMKSIAPQHLLLANIDSFLAYIKHLSSERASGQANLFAALSDTHQPKIVLEDAPELDPTVSLEWEKELLGLYISGHPLDGYRKILEKESIPFAELKDHPKKDPVTLIGMVTYIKRITTRKGEQMAFVGIADHTAEIEGLVFPKLYTELMTLIQEKMIVKVVGKLNSRDGSLKLIIDEMEEFDIESRREKGRVMITTPSEIKKSVFLELKEIFEQYPGQYSAYLYSGGRELYTQKMISLDAIPKIEALFGREQVAVVE